MQRCIPFFLTLVIGSNVLAQSEMSAFTATGRAGAATTFVTDYQSMGINPANLGWEAKDDKMISLGLLEGGFSIYSEALVKSDLVASLKKGKTDFTYDEKVQASQDFTEAGFTANIDISLLAFAVQPSKKVGGFAFGIKDRFQWYSQFTEELSEILFVGYSADYFTHLIISTIDSLGAAGFDTILNADDLPNDTLALIEKGFSLFPKLLSDIMGDSRMSLSWYREYNFSYGRQLLSNENISLYAGVGFKYLSGMAIMEVRTNNGVLEAYSALTPALGVNYGDSAEASNPSTILKGDRIVPKSVGSGMGFDFGVSVVIGDKLKLGASINDIGSMTWDGNVYHANDDSLFHLTSSGFDSYNILKEAQDVMGEDGMFDWSGVIEKKVTLPTNIRMGASFEAGEKLEVGMDIIVPVNDVAGNYGKALMAFGLDVTPLPWLRLSTGFSSGGNYGFNVPLGVVVMIGEGTWEMGVASRDVVTLFSETGPTLSLSAGFLRFRF
jgi:hypothetical protein